MGTDDAAGAECEFPRTDDDRSYTNKSMGTLFQHDVVYVSKINKSDQVIYIYIYIEVLLSYRYYDSLRVYEREREIERDADTRRVFALEKKNNKTNNKIKK